ncbi:hypothetical protein AB8O64_05875 [Streptomyces sp. QH1-20]|uniref:hypothetical protein n=1 Tax=Streptomyces sp. QH1-20 TaxID=3240934 RepID=UPI003517BE38
MTEQQADDAGADARSNLDPQVANAVRTAAAPVTAEEAVEVESEGVVRHRPGLLVTEEHTPQAGEGPSFRLAPSES